MIKAFGGSPPKKDSEKRPESVYTFSAEQEDPWKAFHKYMRMDLEAEQRSQNSFVNLFLAGIRT